MKNDIKRMASLIKSDGCTASPDKILWADLKECCQEHDFYYRVGAEGVSRRTADRRLRHCMQSKGLVISPWIYWAAVRLFGGRSWKSEE